MYVRLHIPAGLIKGVPVRVAMARNTNVIALTTVLTNGSMLQAFRVTADGLVEIKVNGQLNRGQYAVGLSPDGTHLVTGQLTASTPGFSMWIYNSATGEYDYRRATPNFVTYRPEDFEWMDGNYLVMTTGSYTNKNQGSIRADDISGNSENMLNQVLTLAYAGTELFRTENNRNLIASTWNNAAATTVRTFVWNPTTRRVALTTASQFDNGGPSIAINKDGTRIVTSRPTGTTGGPATSVMSASGVDATYAISTTNLQTGINNEYSQIVQLTEDLVMTNANNQYRFYQYNPAANNTLVEIPVPPQYMNIPADGKTLRWAKNTNYNNIMVGYDGSTADLFVYAPVDKYNTEIVTDLLPITTTGVIDAPIATRTNVVLNNITTQIISGEDQATGVFNLKLTTAFSETEPGPYGRFSYESFNQQYMHGKTVIPSLFNEGLAHVDNVIENAETFISPIETTGEFILPPQFEGETIIPSMIVTGSLKGEDFFFGDTELSLPLSDGNLTGGESLEIYQYLDSITSEGVIDAEYAITDETFIASISTEGLIEPTYAITLENEISPITSEGYINAPWTIDSDTTINPIEAAAVLVYGYEGGSIDVTVEPISTEAITELRYPETAIIDVLIGDIETSGEIEVPEYASGDVIISDISTAVDVDITPTLVGGTVIETPYTEGYFIKTIQIDTAMYLRMLQSNGFIELVNGATVNTQLNKIITEAFVRMIRRKRYLNIT